MSKSVRIIVVNSDESVAADLKSVLLSIDGVKIVAEIDEPALLASAMDSFPAEAILVHLDPAPGAMMDIVAPLIESRKNRIAAIAMTEDKDPELIMRAMRAGMKEFLWKPFPPEQLREIIARLSGEGPATGKHVGRLISVVGTGGGVGATQLAANLGVEIAQLERQGSNGLPAEKPRVALVDLDFRVGQIAMALDAQPSYTIAELCETAESLDTQMIERAMFRHATGVHVLARPSDPSAADRISAGQCAGALAALQEHYDYIVVDLPPRFDSTARAVFDMADTYMLVFQLMVPGVRAADRLLHDLASTGYAMNRVRLAANRVVRDACYLDQADVEATLRRRIDFILPDEWKTSATAVNMGAPLFLHAPKSKLRLAYQAIAESLAGGGGEPASEAPTTPANPKKGLFSMFAGAKA